MMIRTIGQKFHLIRNIYDPSKTYHKRQETIGRIPRHTQSLADVPADLLKLLTDKEKEQLKQKIDHESKETRTALRSYALQNLSKHITEAYEALEIEGAPLTKKEAAQIHAAMDKLKSQLRSRGYSRKDALGK